MVQNITRESTSTENNFTLSFFNKKTDSKPKERECTWSQIKDILSTFIIRKDKDGPLFSPAKFLPAHRNKGNVVELSLLVLDYDHDLSINAAIDTWERKGLSFALYTTHSHQQISLDHPKQEDRFRIVIPLNKPIPSKEFQRLWKWAHNISSFTIDEACKDPSRMYYLPAIAHKDAPSLFHSFEGEHLKWQEIEFPETARSQNRSVKLTRYANTIIEDEVSRVMSAPKGQRNNALNQAAYNIGQLHSGGILEGDKVVTKLAEAALKNGLPESEIKATIISGFTSGKKKPRFQQEKTHHQTRNGTHDSIDLESNIQKEKQERPAENTANTSAYKATQSGLIHLQQTINGLVPFQLTNFCAQIVSDVVEDDGMETKRAFEIEAQLYGKSSRFSVPADDFHLMKWPMVNLGAKAVIYPRRADHARCAIQMLSDSPIEKRIYTHTGWRNIDGEMIYLHGGGAIGSKDVKNIEVSLPESLALAVLPDPPKDDAWAESMSAVLELANLAPDEISLPAIGAAFSSVIGHADFSIWLYGPTGSGKSQFAALIQSFFGKFNADKLPGSWMSTANALEAIAHAAKDMILVVDDFKPTGSHQDRARLNRDADRLLRAQGNQHGRQRMAADTTQRKAKHPRGLIFNTAEEVPRGESLVSRLFVIECQKNSIDFKQLSILQKMVAHGVFSTSMSGFIRWLAKHHSEVIEPALKKISELRDEWSNRRISNHRRYATTLGHLSYSWSLWIKAAIDSGAISSDSAVRLKERVNFALGLAGQKQDAHTNTQNPVIRFLELLPSAFASGKAHLEHISGGPPLHATLWGWRTNDGNEQPFGDRIGWHTGEEIYLLPDSTFAMLERFSASGEGVGVQQTTLWKHLFEAGILTTKDEKRRTYSVRKAVSGKTISVLVLCAEKLSTYPDNADITAIGTG